MNFVDVSQFKIVEMRRFSTLRLSIDADKYLDASLEDSAQYLQSLLRVNYKSPSVFYNVSIKGDELSEEDFELICENLVSIIFRHNALVDVRSEAEKESVLNALPGNH